MSCNIRIPIQQIIDDVAAALSGRYISTDNPFLNEAVLTDTTLRGDVTADTTARAALCGILQNCGVTAEELEWLARPDGPGKVALSSTASGETVTTWQNLKDLVTSYGFSQEYNTRKVYPSYAAMLADKDKLRSGAVVDVTGDSIVPNNGTYIYDGVSFTKSPYDGLSLANIYTDEAIESLLTEGSITDSNVKTIAKRGGVERWQADKNLEFISIKDFGAVGDGIINDTAALNMALNSGGTIYLPDGVYLYDYIDIQNPVKIVGTGTLLYSGASPLGVAYSITATAAFSADELNIRTAGLTDTAENIARFTSDNVSINKLIVHSDAQRNQTGGCVFLGSDVYVGYANFRNIARPLAFTNEDGNAENLYKWRSNVHVGTVVVDTYIRGIKFRCIENLSLKSAHISGVWLGRTMAPGFNGVLVETMKEGVFGDLYIADSLEHGFRIGGNEGSHGWSINSLYTKNTLGCGFKNAPTPPFRSSEGYIGSITAYDPGIGSQTANNEGVRLSSLDDTTIGAITVLKRTKDALLLSDVSRLRIGKVFAEGISSRAISFNQDRDMTIGICDDVSIDEVIAYCEPTARYAIGAFYNAPGRYINNLRIGNAYLTGYNFAAVGLTDTDIRNSEINITTTAADVAVGFDGDISNTVMTHHKRLGGNYFGMAKNAYTRGAVTVDSPQLQVENNDNKAGLYVSSLAVPVGINTYGGWLGFSRLQSSRRGAAVAIRQTGDTSNKNGLALMVQNNTTSANESLQVGMTVKHNGVINVPQVPTSATGLVAGDIWNDAGTLKIV